MNQMNKDYIHSKMEDEKVFYDELKAYHINYDNYYLLYVQKDEFSNIEQINRLMYDFGNVMCAWNSYLYGVEEDAVIDHVTQLICTFREKIHSHTVFITSLIEKAKKDIDALWDYYNKRRIDILTEIISKADEID